MRSKRAIINIISNLLLQVIVFIYGFILPKIIIVNFGSAVNGLVSSVTQFLGYITLLESGFGPVVKSLLYKPIAKKNKSEIVNILFASEKFFRTISIIFIFYIAILACFYPLIVISDFDYLFTMSLIIIISISTFFEYYFGMSYRLYLQAEQKTYIVSIIQIIIYLVSILLIIIMAKLNFSIHMIKLVSGLIFIFKPIILNIYVKRKYLINLNIADKNYKIKQKWDGLAQHIATVIHLNTDMTILTFFTNIMEVSVYSVYFLVVKGVKMAMQSLIDGIDSTFGDMLAKKEYENLNKKFSIYETIYLLVCTILYSCTLLLITSFVKVYTLGITDVRYERYLFGVLLVLGEMIWAIRQPYHALVKAGGFFKETRFGAWLESIINIVISIILVQFYGIVGVAIGTLISMLIRTIELIIFSSIKIMKRKKTIIVKKIFLIIVEVSIICVSYSFIVNNNISNYMSWIQEGLKVFVLSCFVCISLSILFYKNDIKYIFNYLKIFKRR